MAGNGTDPEAVSPPAGNGNSPGFGEAFTLDLNTGQASYAVDLTLPEGIAGWQPKLKLEYQQNGDVGPFGAGWQLPIRSIDRRLDFGTSGAVERLIGDGQDLVEIAPGEYRAQVEAAFARYRRQGDGWVVEERTGVRHELGTTTAYRVSDPADPTRILSWLLVRSLDTSGNEITYGWEQDSGCAYLTSITYASYTVRLTYEQRPDVRRNGRAGFLRTMNRRCAGVELHVATPGGDRLVRRWTLGYVQAPYTATSLLDSVQLSSFGPATDGSGDVVRPAQRFGYSQINPAAWHARFVDYDADSPPPPLTDPDTVLTPLSEGSLPGVLQARGGRFAYWPNDGSGEFAAGRPLTSVPATLGLRASGLELLDVDADGRVDLLVGVGGSGPHGYYAHGDQGGWDRFVSYPQARQAVPPFALGTARLADTDGDGCVDAVATLSRGYAHWHNDGEQGWDTPTFEPMGDGDAGPDANLADTDVRFADMTGDGLSDLVRVRSGRVEYWPNLGNGRFGGRVVMTGTPRLPVEAAPDSVQLADIDGDGCADLVVVDSGGVRVWINQSGQGYAMPIADPLVPAPIPGTLLPASMRGVSGADLVWCAPRSGKDRYVTYDTGALPSNLLVSVDNGAGLVSQIDYTTAAAEVAADRAEGVAPARFLPFPLTVVQATREADQASGRVAESRYRYHDGYWDDQTRIFQGFAQVEKREIGDQSRPDRRTVFHFRVAQDRQPGAGREQAALNRMLACAEVYQLDGSADEMTPYRVDESDHAVRVLDTSTDGRQRVLVTVTRMAQRWSERTTDERVEEHSYTYDDDGNVATETIRCAGTEAGIAAAELVRVHEFTYAKDAARNLVDRPARVTQRDAAGKLLTDTLRFYDGADYVGLALGSVTRGLPTRELVWVAKRADFTAHYAGMDRAALGYVDETDADGDDAVFVARKRSAYDAAGRLVGERSPTGTTTKSAYDPTGLFRVEMDGPLGTTRATYDLIVGKPVQTVDADGSTVEMRYDAQGRLTRVVLPDDTLALPSRTYTYDDTTIPNAVRASQRRTHGAADTLDSVVYFDGTMTELQRRVVMDTGKVVVSERQTPNPWRDMAVQYEPTFDTSLAYSPPQAGGGPTRTFRYDAEGRPVGTVDYNGGSSTAAYRPLEIAIADADDNDQSADNQARGQFQTPRLERVDAAHQRIAIIEHSGLVTTSYEPSPLGELAAVSDGAGVVARYTYDGLGNRLTIDHRDAGTRTLYYDAGGRTVRVVDAAGADVQVTFDAADRIATLSVNGVEQEHYTYDDIATNGFGRLHQVSYPDGRQQFAYNHRGQVVTHTYDVNGQAQPFVFQYAYDALGKQRSITYPNGETVIFDQYTNGMPRSVSGIVDQIDYDPRMLVSRIAYANGVTTTVDYTAGPGRVNHQQTTGPGGVLDDQTFTYDAGMHLLGVAHAEPGSTGDVSYTYDPLYQLTRSVDQRGGGLDVAYTYTDRRITANGESGLRLFYEDAAHAGRVTRLEQGAAATSSPVGYDANGCITSFLGRTLTFAAKGELARVVRGQTTIDYAYDHRGRRLAKRVTRAGVTNETLFFGPLAEYRDGALTRYITIGQSRVAIIRQGQTRWIHTDPLGSATFFTDETGARIARISYQAFGNPYPNTVTPPQQVFALHEWDEDAGLYFMQSRYYSPDLARFVSPDPVYLHRPDKQLDDPRTLELYCYVGNDPTDNVDPSGASFWTVLGGIIGVVVAVIVAVIIIAAFMCGVGWGILAVVGLVGLVTGGYALASANQGNWFGDFMKGFLIGLNAGLNAIALSLMGFPIVGLVLGVLAFLSVFDAIRQNSVYQGILGWTSWLMPMSWVATGLGLVFFLLSVLPAIFTLNKVSAVHINYIHIDWATGSIIVKGGWISDLNAYHTAFDLGHFVYVDSANTSPDDDVPHELGHMLSLAIFGSIVHFVGFVDEFAINHGDAWTERMADSHSPSKRAAIIAAGGTPDDTWHS